MSKVQSGRRYELVRVEAFRYGAGTSAPAVDDHTSCELDAVIQCGQRVDIDSLIAVEVQSSSTEVLDVSGQGCRSFWQHPIDQWQSRKGSV